MADEVPNAAPNAVADTASVSEDDVLTANGSVLSNDTDADSGDTLSVATVNGQAAGVGATIVGTYGSLVLGANGAYAYTLNNAAANVQALSAGQTVQDVFQYTVSDGHSHTTTVQQQTQNLITQSEAFDNSAWFKFGSTQPAIVANSAAGPTGGGTTAEQITLTNASSGVYFRPGVTGEHTFSIWVRNLSGSANFTLNYYNGSTSTPTAFTATADWQRYDITFTGNGAQFSNVAFMHGTGQSQTGVFQIWGAQLNTGADPMAYVATTGSAIQSTTVPVSVEQQIGSTLTINVTGSADAANAAPVAVADTASASEDNVLSATGNVLTNDTDADNDALTVATVNGQAANVGATITGTYGSLVLGANGAYSYTLNNTAANVQALAAGQTVSEVFNYGISDGKGGTSASTLTVSVAGANEAGVNAAPVATADTAGVSEDDVLSATGSVLTNDTDADSGDTLSVASVNGQAAGVGATIVGTYGSLVLGANGAYTYTLNNGAANVQALSAGQTVQDVFQYTVSDGHSHTTTVQQQTQNLITQSEAFNNSAWFKFGSTQPAIVTNSAAGPTGVGTTAEQITLTSASSGVYFRPAVTGEHTFSIWVRNLSGSANFSLNYYNGSTSTPTAFTATADWQRYDITFTGNGAQFSNVAFMHGTGQSQTGVFQIWGAQLNTGADPMAYVATTGSVIQSTTVPVSVEQQIGSTLTINVSGANEGASNTAPVATADTASVAEDDVLSATGNVLTNDTDADNDALTVASVNGQAANVGATITGTYGSLVLGANGAYTYTLANTAANVQALAAGQTVSEVFNYAISDGKGGTSASTLTVSVGGADEANTAPVAMPDPASVSEDNVLSATGNVLANDTDANGDTLTVSKVNGQAANVGATITGTYGSFVLNANGAYTYALANSQANVQALGAFETVYDGFTYEVSDGKGGAATQTVEVSVTGAAETTNTAPVALADTASVSEDNVLSATGNVLTNDTDANNDPLTVVAVNPTALENNVGVPVSGTYGSLTLNANGAYTYTLANTQANVQALAAGQTVSEVFEYRISDGKGGISISTLTVSVGGADEANVAPVAVADTASVSEDNVLSATGNVLTNDTDANNDALTVATVNGQAANVGATITGTYGSLVLGANGAYTYTLANTAANVQALVAGQTVSEVFNYAISDGKGGTSASTLTVSVGGADEVNAAPVATADTASVSEDNVLSATGNVLTNDTDANNDALTVATVNGQAANVGATITGTYGSLVLGANGAYTYTLANTAANVQALAAGQTVSEVFNYGISDGRGGTSASTLTVSVGGADEANTPPVAAEDTAHVSEDNVLTAAGNVLANDTDADNDTLTVASVYGQASNVGATVTGTYGSLVLNANGAYSYTLNNANADVQALNDGQTVIDVFAVVVSDGRGGTASSLLKIIVDGANEAANAPPAAVADTASVSEDNVLSATGNVLTNDTDADNDALTVATVNGQAANVGATITGTYGSLVLGANGAYTYTLANTAANVQALAAGQTVSEVFNYGISDGKGGTSASTLTVSVAGAAETANVAPVAVADTASVSEDDVLTANGSVLSNDTDADAGDTLSVATVNGQAAGVGATIVGTYGSLVLGANGAYAYTLNNAAANVQALSAGQTVQDVFQYTVSDGHSHTTTVQQQSQNLITQSEAFDNSAWFKFGSTQPAIVANSAAGPTGVGTTAEQITLTSATSGVYFRPAVTGQHTFSIWVRNVSGDANFSLNYYNGSTGTPTAFTATSQWQRYDITFTGNGAQFSNVAFMHGAGQSQTGVFQIWGAQLNTGADPMAYVATTGSAIQSTTVPVSVEQQIGSTLTVTVTGASEGDNATPVAVADTASVSEDDVLTANGSVLSNDTDADAGDTLSVATVNGQAAGVGATIVGTYGSLVLGANGAYAYTLNNAAANVQALSAGQTVQDVFQYTVSDGHSHTTTVEQQTQNLITQSEAFDNDTAWIKFGANLPSLAVNVAAGPTGAGTTAEQVTLTSATSGVYFRPGVTGEHTFSIWVRSVSGDANFSLNYYNGTTSTPTAFAASSQWQRYDITFTGNGAQFSNVAFMHGSGQSQTGVFQIWGAQLNTGADPMAYVATTGSAIQNTTVPVVIEEVAGATLSITVTGAADTSGDVLSLANDTKAVVANLATGEWTHALRVMPFGDSITYGWRAQDREQGRDNTADGYRGPLWSAFTAQNTLIDMVGPQVSRSSDLLDGDHAGYPGWRADQLDDLVSGLMSGSTPNAILLMAGTNDVLQEASPESAIGAELRGMFNSVAAADPTAHVYVATLIPVSGDQSSVDAVNAVIRSTVTQAIADGLKVSLVDMSAVTLSDLYDGVHPTESGYAKIAQIWYDAILAQQALSGGTPGGQVTAIDANVTSIIGGSGGDLLIGDGRANQLYGGDGDDRLIGGDGADTLNGGAGVDNISGGAGKDVMSGGAGADIYQVSSSVTVGTADLITDWATEDRLHFANGVATAVNYAEGIYADYASAQAAANSMIAGGATNFVAVQIGSDVVVFADSAADNGSADEAVVLLGKSLADISYANLV